MHLQQFARNLALYERSVSQMHTTLAQISIEVADFLILSTISGSTNSWPLAVSQPPRSNSARKRTESSCSQSRRTPSNVPQINTERGSRRSTMICSRYVRIAARAGQRVTCSEKKSESGLCERGARSLTLSIFADCCG